MKGKQKKKTNASEEGRILKGRWKLWKNNENTKRLMGRRKK